MPASTAQYSPVAGTRSQLAALLRALPLVALFAGAAITFSAWKSAEQANRNSIELRFDAHFQKLLDTLEHEIDIHTLALRSLSGLFLASNQVTREEFHDDIATMQLPKYLLGVQAVGYAIAVPASELAAHVDQVRADGLEAYTVWPPTGRADHAPLMYVEPSSPDNSRALGFDLLSDPLRAATLAQAAQRGDVSMTPPLGLLNGPDGGIERELTLYLPDFCARAETRSSSASPPRVCGWVFMSINITRLLEALLPHKLHYFGLAGAVAIIDNDAPEATRDIYQTAEFTASQGTQYQRQTRLSLAGRTWTVTARMLPRFVAKNQSYAPAWTLSIGSAATLLIALFFLVLARNDKRLLTAVDEAVDARQRLSASQAQLQASERSHREMFAANSIPMWVYDLETLRFLEVNNAAVRCYGYSREEFLEMKITDIRPAGDLPRLQSNIAAVTEGFDDAGLWRHLTRDGHCIDVHIHSNTLIFNGRRAELVMAQDVTARLQAEAKLLARNQELERFNKLMVDRELAIIDLKREINSLSQQLGVSPPHDLAAIDDAQRAWGPGNRA